MVVGHRVQNENGKNTTYMHIPHNGELDELLAVVPFQLLAYYLSLENKNDPDFPRNLAKSVVVY